MREAVEVIITGDLWGWCFFCFVVVVAGVGEGEAEGVRDEEVVLMVVEGADGELGLALEVTFEGVDEVTGAELEDWTLLLLDETLILVGVELLLNWEELA